MVSRYWFFTELSLARSMFISPAMMNLWLSLDRHDKRSFVSWMVWGMEVLGFLYTEVMVITLLSILASIDVFHCSQNLIYYSATDFDNTMANKWRYMVQQGRKVLERAELEQSVYFTSTQRKWVQKYVLLEILGHASIPWCIGWLVFGFIKIQFCIL